MDEGTRFQVLAPVVRGRKGEYVDLFAELQSKGFARARVDGVVHALTEPPKLKKQEKHTIEVVVDRLAVKASAKQRMTDSIETALKLASGIVLLDFVDLPEDDEHRERKFSEHLACPNDHPLAIEDLEPRSFSFNAPYGACPECTGLGTKKEVDPELIVPDPERTLREGAIQPWSSGHTLEYFLRLLEALGDAGGVRPRHAVAQDLSAGAEGDPARRRGSGARAVPQQVRAGAVLLHRVRGRGAVDRAPALRHRVGLVARQVRGVHARRARVRPAAAPGSSRRSWPSRSPGATSPTSARCRSASATTSSTRWSSTTGSA